MFCQCNADAVMLEAVTPGVTYRPHISCSCKWVKVELESVDTDADDPPERRQLATSEDECGRCAAPQRRPTNPCSWSWTWQCCELFSKESLKDLSPEKMEAEVESLRQRVEQLERLVKGEGGEGEASLQPSQCGAEGPTLRPMPEYDQVWKFEM